MLFLLELLSAVLRPMRSLAFSSSSCCCRLLSDFPSDVFPRRSEPEAGFRRSFSLIICAARGKKNKFMNKELFSVRANLCWFSSYSFLVVDRKSVV